MMKESWVIEIPAPSLLFQTFLWTPFFFLPITKPCSISFFFFFFFTCYLHFPSYNTQILKVSKTERKAALREGWLSQ